MMRTGRMLAAVAAILVALPMSSRAANEWTPKTPSGATRGIKLAAGDTLLIVGPMVIGVPADSSVSATQQYVAFTGNDSTAGLITLDLTGSDRYMTIASNLTAGMKRRRNGTAQALRLYSTGRGAMRFSPAGYGSSGSAWSPQNHTVMDTIGRWGIKTAYWPDSTFCIGGGLQVDGGARFAKRLDYCGASNSTLLRHATNGRMALADSDGYSGLLFWSQTGNTRRVSLGSNIWEDGSSWQVSDVNSTGSAVFSVENPISGGRAFSWQVRLAMDSTTPRLLWQLTGDGDLTPGSDNAYSIGNTQATPDSIYAHHALTVGDIPYLDTMDDVAAIRAIRSSGQHDEAGRELVDDYTLPRAMMLTHREDAPARTDTTWTETQVKADSTLSSYEVPVAADGLTGEARPVWTYSYRTDRRLAAVRQVPAHRKGDLVLGAAGKPFYDTSAAIGLLQGAVRQLAATDDSLRVRTATLERRLVEVESRLMRLETR